METFAIGPEAGKVYQSKKGYPCKADCGIDDVTAQVRQVELIGCGWSQPRPPTPPLRTWMH